MTELDLSSAVDQIVRATRKRSRHGTPPFFFIVGAGVSHPPIPLAAGIEQICRKEIADQGRTPPPVEGSPLHLYQACFEMAFEQAEERRIFLHELLHPARISAANFRLAHLLSDGDVTKLVFTPNFDEMLTRALRLFGHDVIACDHPKTTQRIDPGRRDLQVIHVHGTHWFYDCCNLRGEIEGQADLADSLTMGQLLDRVLADRSPLVVGYSGWEGDVLMTALHRRLQQPILPFNLYWFCYRRSERDSLPGWLRDHVSVRLVLPPKAPVAPVSQTPERRRIGSVEALAAELEGEGSSSEPVLPARDVFEAFIQTLDLKAPYLTAEPLDFFLQHLVRNLDPEDASGRLFLIREVLNRVRVGAECERSRRLGDSTAHKAATEALRNVNDAVRRSAYPAAAQAAEKIEVSVLSEEQRKDLDDALSAAYLGLADADANLVLGLCETWDDLAEAALVSGSPDRNAWSTSAARALIGKGYCLAKLGRTEAALETWSNVIQRFGDAQEPALREQAVKALFNQGISLKRAGKPEAAIEAWTKAVQRFGNALEPAVLEHVANALFNQGLALWEVGKPGPAAKAWSEVVKRFGDAAEPALREPVAMALFNLGLALRQVGKPDAAIEAWSQVVQRLGESPEPDHQEGVAKALFNQAGALSEAGKPLAAIEIWSEVVQRFGERPEPPLRELVAAAFVNRGAVLRETGKPSDAIEVWSNMVQRFGDAPEPSIREQVAIALCNQGVALSEAGNPEGAIEAWSKVVQRFGDSAEPALRELVAKARACLRD